MGNKSTYKAPLTFLREDGIFKGAICLSGESFVNLQLKMDQYLHPTEKAYFSNLKFPRRQHSYLMGRYCAKHALAAYLNEDSFTDTLIENGVLSQPIVFHPHHNNLQVSITHSEILGGSLAFPESHPLAIDIEGISQDRVKTIETQILPGEKKLVSNLEKINFFTLLWTIKEALSKVLKCGCMMSFELLEIESIELHESYTLSTFKHFHQYQALSFKVRNSYCSIVYPKKSILEIDIPAIQKYLLVYPNFSNLVHTE